VCGIPTQTPASHAPNSSCIMNQYTATEPCKKCNSSEVHDQHFVSGRCPPCILALNGYPRSYWKSHNIEMSIFLDGRFGCIRKRWDDDGNVVTTK
jgi:hypothetical protein